jgi:hypothetical protein
VRAFEDEEHILQLYRDGWSVRQLARHLGVRTKLVSELLERRAEPLHPGGKAHPLFRSSQQCEEVAARYRDGLSLRELADLHGCSTPPIARALERAGEPLRVGAPVFWTDERNAWLVEQYRAGRSQASIGSELGLSQACISDRLRRLEATPPRVRPKRADHPMWKGGRVVTPSGYVWVKTTPNDLDFCTPQRNGYALEHRLVMGRALGRKLRRSETVHHINGQRDDNRIENLQLRQGTHGKGVVMECLDCGSHNLGHVEIATV